MSSAAGGQLASIKVQNLGLETDKCDRKALPISTHGGGHCDLGREIGREMVNAGADGGYGYTGRAAVVQTVENARVTFFQ